MSRFAIMLGVAAATLGATSRRTTLVTLTALAVLISLVAASLASADAPVIVEKQNSLTRHFANLPDCEGSGFTHTEDYQVTRSVTQFYDREGTLVREVLHIRFVGTATNDETGKTLPITGTRHLVFAADGTFTETGVLRHVTVRGDGIVLQESGRVMRPPEEGLAPLFVAGPHQLLEGDIAAFCAALAGS
jgi:hypothetical protein